MADSSHSIVNDEVGSLHKLLVDRVLDYAIFALDPHGYVLSWNAGAERLKGYRPEEIIGKHFSIFYPREAIADGLPERNLAAAIANGRVEDEGWRVRKDGTRFWADVLITTLRGDDGEVLGFAKVTRDLTARRAAEEELRQSDERFRLLVKSVKDYAIFMLDPRGHIVTWNEGAQRIKGYTEDEIIGKHFSIFYPPEDVASGKLERELEIATRTGQYSEEGWRVRKGGARFWASVVITALRGPHGELAGFAKVTRDLTERRAAQELEIRNKEALAANRAKSEFLAAMSHELRTPLNAIGGYTQLLQMQIPGPLTPDQAEHLARIQRSQQHLLGIINDILNFSRVEAGQVDYAIETFRVLDVVEGVVPMIEPQLRQRELTLHRSEDALDLAVRADRSKVEQILINLLSNAIKFTPAGGRVEVTWEDCGQTVALHVSDTGIGIQPAHLESIFAPFVQVGRSLANPKEGTGLGLAISRDLAKAMSGDLSVQSKEGAGSTFTLTLPHG
ncbi:MAG TPA: PAS domain S-box protein [Gemmatimonadaceae bacterium]|nr:PAS domain S-box protein [Gemmatimonadaceae bacterium]